MHYVPQRGDIVYLDFNPQTGNEQRGRRPAIVLSRWEYNQMGLALFVPITSGVGLPATKGWKVCIDGGNDKVVGHALCDQVKSLDWKQRNIKKQTTLHPDYIEDIIRRITSLLK